MDLGLRGSTVLVTGSSSGIGRATAIAFGREGANVAVTYHKNREGAEDTATMVREAGGRALVMYYDLADALAIEAAVRLIHDDWVALNVLVNNAVPTVHLGPTNQLFEDVGRHEWQSMLRSTLEGVVLTIQCALPLMRKGGWGRIVNVSSDATDGWPGLGPYATAKAGLHGLARTLAKELGPVNILTNVVVPGFVLTETNRERVPASDQEQIKEHTPTRQLATPEDLAAIITFLGSPINRQVTGQVIRANGGR